MKPEILIRSAATAPTSWNEADRTVDVNFSTFADVQRIDSRGPYIERLDKSGLDLSRLIGASVLNSHRQTNLGDILGVVLKATKDGVAKLQLSARNDVAPFVADIAAGLIRHLSIRYSIGSWKESIDPKSGARIKTAARWTPVEISFVPVPADFGAQTRGASNMEPEQDAPEVPAIQTPANDNAVRNQAIRTLCRSNGLPQDFTDSLIDGEGDLIAARAAVNAELIRRQPTIRPQASVGFSNEDPSVVRARKIDARAAREMGTAIPEAARPYAYMTLLDHAKDDLQRAGESVRGVSPDEIFQRAASHGTSDFVEVTTGTGRRVAESAYVAAASPIKQVCRSSTFTDFRAKKLLRMSGAGLLEEMNEHGEFTGTTKFESVENYTPTTFGRMFGISRKALIGDDLGMLADQARVFGVAAAQTEAAQIVQKLESNPALSDGFNLFSSDHANVDLSNTQIGIESISAARLAMRQQRDLDDTLISVAPKYLLVSAELETAAQVFVAAYQPIALGEANPFSALIPLVEPRLAPFTWYLFADPATAPVIEYAHMAGASGVIVESRAAWTTLGLETRAYLDFGVGVVGAKGAYYFASGQDSNSEVM